MQLFITDKISKLLESTMQENKNITEILKVMGITYVSFFVENPAYFQFLYSQSNIKIDLSLSISDKENYSSSYFRMQVFFSKNFIFFS